MPQLRYTKPFEYTICKKNGTNLQQDFHDIKMPSIVITIYLLFSLIFCQKVLLMNGKECSYTLSTNDFLLLFEKPANK